MPVLNGLNGSLDGSKRRGVWFLTSVGISIIFGILLLIFFISVGWGWLSQFFGSGIGVGEFYRLVEEINTINPGETYYSGIVLPRDAGILFFNKGASMVSMKINWFRMVGNSVEREDSLDGPWIFFHRPLSAACSIDNHCACYVQGIHVQKNEGTVFRDAYRKEIRLLGIPIVIPSGSILDNAIFNAQYNFKKQNHCAKLVRPVSETQIAAMSSKEALHLESNYYGSAEHEWYKSRPLRGGTILLRGEHRNVPIKIQRPLGLDTVRICQNIDENPCFDLGEEKLLLFFRSIVDTYEDDDCLNAEAEFCGFRKAADRGISSALLSPAASHRFFYTLFDTGGSKVAAVGPAPSEKNSRYGIHYRSFFDDPDLEGEDPILELRISYGNQVSWGRDELFGDQYVIPQESGAVNNQQTLDIQLTKYSTISPEFQLRVPLCGKAGKNNYFFEFNQDDDRFFAITFSKIGDEENREWYGLTDRSYPYCFQVWLHHPSIDASGLPADESAMPGVVKYVHPDWIAGPPAPEESWLTTYYEDPAATLAPA